MQCNLFYKSNFGFSNIYDQYLCIIKSALGKGKSKKVAKRLAAQKMLTFLQGVPCEDNNTNFGLDDEDEVQ